MGKQKILIVSLLTAVLVNSVADLKAASEKTVNCRKAGDKITFDKVLLTDDGKETKVGAPYVSGAKVSAELIEEGREAKVTVIRYRQKSRYFKKKGHRQAFAKVKITALP